MPAKVVEEWSRPVRTAPRPDDGPLPWKLLRHDTVAGGDDIDPFPRLYIRTDVVSAINGRSREGALRRREDMGLLMGDWAMDPDGRPYAVAMDVVSGTLKASPVSVRFTEEGLTQVARALDDLEYRYVIVGWYHTHLDLGCFLSDRDLRTQRGGFPHRHQVAVVVDPTRGQACAFANGDDGPGTVRATMASYDEWGSPSIDEE